MRSKNLNPTTPIQRRLSMAALGVALFVSVSAVTTAHANPKIRCGSPSKSGGKVTITIGLKNGGEVFPLTLRDIDFPKDYPDSSKAEFIAELINQTDHETHIHASHANGSNEIELFGLYGWELDSHSIGQDSTGEPDWIAYDGASTGGTALCSLSGTATGTSPTGGQAMAGIQAFGGQAHIATAQGMPAQAVEQMLMQQLQSQGIPVRWAVPGDFTGGFAGLQHDDSVLFISSPNENAPGSMFNMVMDDGLQLDLMAIADPANPTSETPVGEGAGLAAVRLDVAPSVFATGAMTVRYAAGTRPGPARVTAIDVTGRTIATLFEGAAGGTGSFTWDATDRDHRAVSAGVYFLRLETPDGAVVRRVTRIR